MVDPRTYRISQDFVLSDLLGCHSVYSLGYANSFDFDDKDVELKLANIKCLCEYGLEPLMKEFGGCSISYSYLSPELSDATVRYQDPRKSSHHLWSLGAAADVCCHNWIAGDFPTPFDLYLPTSAIGSPIALLHTIDQMEIPYSRLISYSESPYLCVALSADEVARGKPRKAVYENRYTGQPKVKPEFLRYPTPVARAKAFQRLQEQGLEHPWQGGGFPSYHAGGKRQYQHMRVSRSLMVSDLLFDLKSITTGAKNVPSLNLDSVQDSFAAAGIVVDRILDDWGIPRISIVGAYISHLNPYFDPHNDWRYKHISFTFNPPENGSYLFDGPGLMMDETEDGFIKVMIDVDEVLNSGAYT